MQRINNYLVIVFILTILGSSSHAQNKQLLSDTIKISLDSAENIFLRNNLQVLAQRYNVDAQKALIIQAKLLPNPNFSFLRGPIFPINDDLSNFPNSTFFSYSENSASLSQLILLAGKRNKQIKLRCSATNDF